MRIQLAMLRLLTIVIAMLGLSAARAAPFMIVGDDEKLLWDDNFKPLLSLPGNDAVLILDLADPLNPKIVGNLPLKNSVVGPPVNLAIDPTNSIALVADSINVTKDGDALKQGPDDKVYVIDLKASPPKLIDTITAGKQPSGLSINRAGTLALVANRAGKSITVLSIKGTAVKVIDTVDMGDEELPAAFGRKARPHDRRAGAVGIGLQHRGERRPGVHLMVGEHPNRFHLLVVQ